MGTQGCGVVNVILVGAPRLGKLQLFRSGPEGPELEGEQADRKFKATNTRRKD